MSPYKTNTLSDTLENTLENTFDYDNNDGIQNTSGNDGNTYDGTESSTGNDNNQPTHIHMMVQKLHMVMTINHRQQLMIHMHIIDCYFLV